MQMLKGHEGNIHGLLFSPDGGTLVSAGKDGAVRLWDSWGEAHELTRTKAVVHSLAFSSDGRHLATGNNDGVLEVWDLHARTSQAKRDAVGRIVTGLAFLGDDATIAYSLADESKAKNQSPGVHFWDWRGNKSRSLPVNVATPVSVRALFLLPEKRLLAWITETHSIIVWNMLQSNRVSLVSKNPSRAVALAPDAKTLAAASGWTAVLYDLERRQPRQTLSGHKAVVSTLAYSPDGRYLMTGSWDKTIKFWDARSDRELASFEWPVGQVLTAAFAPDGLRAAAAGDAGTIVIWDVDL
jgi:WD40 repeat protein